jgi:hypothetical protein
VNAHGERRDRGCCAGTHERRNSQQHQSGCPRPT